MQTIAISSLIIFLGWAGSSCGHLDFNFDKCSFRCGDILDNADNAGHNMAKCPQTAYIFPRRSASDYIRVKTPIAPIDEFSLCTWAKMYGTGTFWGTILSYSTPSNFNQFLILFNGAENGKLHIEALGEAKDKIANSLMTGSDNYICFVIGRTAGFVKVYYNATLNTVLSFDNRNPIPSGGAFIIGQEQDSYIGTFDAKQAIHGEISNYMIWNRVLAQEEIEKMYRSKCNCAQGHTVSLSPDKIQLEGGVNALYVGEKCE